MTEKKRLLIVDDEPHILQSLCRALRQEPYKISTANNAKEALTVLSQEQIDVVLTDQRMPGLSGTELVSIIKQKYPAILSVMISAYSDFDATIAAINHGAIYKFITKPWDDFNLKSILRETIQYQESSIQEQKHKLAFERAFEAIVITNDNQEVESVNTAFNLISEFTLEDIQSKTFKIPPADINEPELLQSMNDALLVHGQWTGQVKLRRKSGKIFNAWLSIAKSPRDIKTTGWIYTFIDIADEEPAVVIHNNLTHFDLLTGLYSRSHFLHRLNQKIDQKSAKPIRLILLDVKCFREINNQVGVIKGDMILKLIADQLSVLLRRSDETLSRVGDDEFALFTSVDYDDYESMIRKIQDLFAKPLVIGDDSFQISFSMASSSYPEEGDSAEALMECANVKLR